MKAIYNMICIFLIFCLSACVAKGLEAVKLRHSGGWEIRINSDGGGSYGFGTIPARIEVTKGTFVFTDVIRDIKEASSRTPKNAEEPYIAVTYWGKGESSAEEHLIAIDQALFDRLFKLARANAVAPQGELQKAEYAVVEKFWKKGPPIAPDKPNAGDGK